MIPSDRPLRRHRLTVGFAAALITAAIAMLAPSPAGAAAKAGGPDGLVGITATCRQNTQAWQAFRTVRPGDPRADLVGLQPVEPASFAPDTAAAALDWLDTERPNLVTIVNQAAATPGIEPELCTRLGLALPMLLVVRGHLRDWLQVSQAVLATA